MWNKNILRGLNVVRGCFREIIFSIMGKKQKGVIIVGIDPAPSW